MNEISGKYNRGQVKVTKNQIKKHVSQITENEKDILVHRINDIKDVYISNYVNNKNISFSKDYILEILHRNNIRDLIVEYNETLKFNELDRRLLIRDDKEYLVNFKSLDGKVFQKYGNFCFVISLLSFNIITVYWNIQEDNHDTIQWNRYDNSLKIIEFNYTN